MAQFRKYTKPPNVALAIAGNHYRRGSYWESVNDLLKLVVNQLLR